MLSVVFWSPALTLVVLVTLAMSIWAFVDAAVRPKAAFSAANSSKILWQLLIGLGWLLTGVIGTVAAIIYLAAIRPRVKAAAIRA